jgi:hypothetical protein
MAVVTVGNNVSVEQKGGKIIITVDSTKSFGKTGSGKNLQVASTCGNVTLEGGFKLGLNIYKPAEA